MAGPPAVGGLSKWGSLESMEESANAGFARWDSSLAVGEAGRGGVETPSSLRRGATAEEVAENHCSTGAATSAAPAAGLNSSFVDAMPSVPVVLLEDDSLLGDDPLSVPAMHRHARPASFRRQAEPALDNSAPLLRDKTMVSAPTPVRTRLCGPTLGIACAGLAVAILTARLALPRFEQSRRKRHNKACSVIRAKSMFQAHFDSLSSSSSAGSASRNSNCLTAATFRELCYNLGL